MALTLISTPLNITESDTAVSEVVINSGLTSSYKAYEIHIIGVHSANGASGANLKWQCNAETGSNTTGYDQIIQSTAVRAYHQEDGTGGEVGYRTGEDQANGTAYEFVCDNTGGDADQTVCAILKIFDPASDVYVKQFILQGVSQMNSDGIKHDWRAGYINAEEPIDDIRFAFSAGDIDAGIIKLYGVS